jgi:sRNA-binding regulator protein Hfq
MANTYSISAPDAPSLRSDAAKTSDPQANATPAGPRKLVRPTLPARILNKNFSRRSDSPVLAHHQAMTLQSSAQDSTHAETFYLQKQAQTQTLMVFVLENDERIEGYIEWYDRNAIKVKNHTRTLIYKSSIKYLYKANEPL